jgi:peptidyl-prolyl cis-trans isomerase B (cyclophilin B)
MSACAPRRGSAPRQLLAVFLAGLALAGCGKPGGPAPHAQTSGDEPPAARTEPKKPDGEAPAPSKPAAAPRDRWHQPFADATRAPDNPPADSNRPPDLTVTGKPVYKLLTDVEALWDTIRFTSPAGKKVAYSATVETDLGSFQIALFPDLAPNHVRNFVALAKAGYYDGLYFDRARAEEDEGRKLFALEAGCPLGTGEPGNGSIGYWLKEEFQPGEKVSHEEGTVGACRGTEPDSAACRFYVTLCPAPFLDGNYTIFGKVVQGLDVVRKMYARPTNAEDAGLGARRPAEPVTIKKVTIQTKEVDAQR